MTEPALESLDTTMSEGAVVSVFHPPVESAEGVGVKWAASIRTEVWNLHVSSPL